MSRDDFEIPDLDNVDLGGRASTVSSGRQSHSSSVPPNPKKGGLGTALLIFVLFIACGGLGYVAYSQYMISTSLIQSVDKLEQQVAELQESLSLAESEVQTSGSSLQGQLGTLNKQVKEKNKQLDSEIAKLWTIAYQRNKPAIEEQKQRVKEVSAQIAELDKNIASISGGISSLYERIDAVAVDASDAREAELKKVRSELASLQTSFILTEETVSDATAELVAQQRGLVDRMNAVELSSDSSELERRIKTTEQAIRSIDNTRRDVNNSLIQLKSRVNSLQLKVEALSN